MISEPFKLLCPFQLRWMRDESALAMGEKSRRIGWTWICALKTTLDVAEGLYDYFHSSADMSASEEYIRYCEEWAAMTNAVAKITDAEEIVEEEKIRVLSMEFASGKRIVAGSSNPKFFRSKGGAAGLDEFAFHAQARELFKAAHATAMFWGYPLRIWSTHNGPASFFNRMITDAREGRLKASLHKVTILDAVEDGICERIRMRKDKLTDVPAADAGYRREWLDELRATCPDEDTWNEEYMCIPSTDGASLLSYDLIRGCEVANLELIDPAKLGSDRVLYAGYDVGRKHDLSVLWVLERVGDVLWTRCVKTMKDTSFSAQEGALDVLLSNPGCKRLCIDSTGIGMQMAERLQQRHGKYRVEAVNFSAPVKSELAMPLRRLFEDRSVRIPKDDSVREDLHSVRKTVNASGNIRLDVDRSDTDGHADRFWALALAAQAADKKIADGIVHRSAAQLPEVLR